MIRVFVTLLIGLFTLGLFAQEKKTSKFTDKKIVLSIKIKPPGMFSKIEKGNILILKVKNTNTTAQNISFKVMEYIGGVVKSESTELANCIKAGKKKKIKVHLENFVSEESYDWLFSDVVVSETELCPKK